MSSLPWPTIVATLYATSMAVIIIYGLNLLGLAVGFARKSRLIDGPVPDPDDLATPNASWPIVTVQLPMFNESYVAERIIDICAELDYPRSKLEIQVLDDSTDDTKDIVEKRVEYWQKRGLDIIHVHRTDRTGYKAGALQNAMTFAKGDLICIFDADFTPAPEYLRRLVPHFLEDPKVGLVQSRWGHINGDASYLTRIQAASLDVHFAIEQYVRNTTGCFMNFNGTAGIWRRECIEDAGGWESDTLTEDLDLSYRAQMKGWKFKYLNEVEVPAELPVDMAALRTQQFRWTKGAAETSFKLLKMLWNAKQPLKVKIEGTFHITNFIVFPFVVMVALIHVPLLVLRWMGMGPGDAYFAVLGLGFLAFAGVVLTQIFAQRALYPNWARRLLVLPGFMAGSMGLSINNTRAVLQAFRGKKTEFVRTPKLSDKATNVQAAITSKNKYSNKKISPVVWLEAFAALYCIAGVIMTIYIGEWAAVPFQAMFAAGFALVSGYNLQQFWTARKAGAV